MAGLVGIRYGVSLPNRTETPQYWQYIYRHTYRYRPNRPITTMITREAAKAVNCNEDRVPNTPDPDDCGHRINKATVTRIAFPDKPDPFDSWPIATLH